MSPRLGTLASHRALLPVVLLASAMIAGPPASAAPRAPATLDGGAVLRESTNTWALAPEITDLDRAAPSPIPDRGAAPTQPNGWEFTSNLRAHPDESGQHIWVDVALAADGTVGVAWMDDHAAGGYHIFYAASTDGGATWSPPERVDDRVAGSYSKFVSLAFTPASIAVAVWEDDRNGRHDVYLSQRDPDAGGTPWTPNRRLNTAGSPPGGSDFMNASLAILDDERYFVAWTDRRAGVFHQVYARATWDGGATWGTETRVSDGLGFEPVAGDPCLIVDPGSGPVPGTEILTCVTNDWRGNVPGGRYPNVYFYRSNDGGATWSVGVQVNDIAPYYQQASSHALVRLDDGSLACGWLNNSDFVASHYHVNRSTDGGATWGASQQVDEGSGTGTYSSIATGEGWLFAAFSVYDTDWDAYFRASSDGGASWSEPMVRMDDDASGAAAGRPVLAAAAAERVHAAWEDTRAPGTNWKIYTATGERQTTSIAPGTSGAASGRVAYRIMPNPSRVGSAVRIVGTTAGSGAIEEMTARIAIYDVGGHLLRRLEARGGPAIWDGRTAAGHQAAAGCYWLRIGTPATGQVIIRLIRSR